MLVTSREQILWHTRSHTGITWLHVLKQSVVCEILIVLQRFACIKAGRTRVYIWCSFGGVRGTRVIMTY